jgi:hypothetical protein
LGNETENRPIAIEREWLDAALSTIHENSEGLFSSGLFITLVGYGVPGDGLPDDLRHHLVLLLRGLWTTETIVARLEWERGLWLNDVMNDAQWMDFAAADITLFHVQVRCVFDCLAQVISRVSHVPKQAPRRSFADLRRRVNKHPDPSSEALGDDLRLEVFNCDWFDDLRTVRDSIVHQGATPIVFLGKPRILFQVEVGVKDSISIPEIMSDEKLVDFELYAGLHVGYLIAYLERVSGLVSELRGFRLAGSSGRSFHPGLGVVRDWIRRVAQ